MFTRSSSSPISVVTGGAGFLGSHLTDRLLAEGHRVIGIDNFLTGSSANIEHLAGNDYVPLHQARRFQSHLPAGRRRFHLPLRLAGQPRSITCVHPIPTLKVGSHGTHNALGLAKAKGARFLLASTSECYGDPLVHPQREDYWGNVNPIGPRGVYDEAKRFAEAMTMAYHRYHQVDTKIVRIFNTYGPRMRLRDGRVVPNFIAQALSGEPLTVYGDGSQTRSFCYCSDLIDGIFRLAMSDFHEPVNIGNPREMTIKEFAEEIVRLTGATGGLKYRAAAGRRPEGAPARYHPRPDHARLGAGGRIRGGDPENDRLFQNALEIARGAAFFSSLPRSKLSRRSPVPSPAPQISPKNPPMKALVFSLAAFAALLSSSFGQVPLRPGDVKIEKVSPSVVKTPEFALSAGPTKRFKSLDWLEVEVEFQTVPEMIDELTFTYKIQVNGKLLRRRGRPRRYSERAANIIPSPICLPARSTRRWAASILTPAAIQGIWVEVTQQGQVLATLGTAKTAVPNLPQVARQGPQQGADAVRSALVRPVRGDEARLQVGAFRFPAAHGFPQAHRRSRPRHPKRLARGIPVGGARQPGPAELPLDGAAGGPGA